MDQGSEKEIDGDQKQDGARISLDTSTLHRPIWIEIRSGEVQPGDSSSHRSEKVLDLEIIWIIVKE